MFYDTLTQIAEKQEMLHFSIYLFFVFRKLVHKWWLVSYEIFYLKNVSHLGTKFWKNKIKDWGSVEILQIAPP